MTKEVRTIPWERKWTARKRCSQEVLSTGTPPFGGEKNKCARAARVSMDGEPYCIQHAGSLLLLQRLDEGRNDD